MKINILKHIFNFIERLKIRHLVVFVALLSYSTGLYAHYPVDFGVELKNMSGTGVLSSFGANALMYNPSSLGVDLGIKNSKVGYWSKDQEGLRLDFSYEQALSYVLLGYKHPDYSMLKFHLVVPPVSLGVRLSGTNWNLGLLLIPLGMDSKQTINKVPFDLDYYITTLIDFTTQRTAANLFLGGSVQLARVSLGASLDFLYDKEKQNILLTETETSEKLWLTKKGKFWGYTLGLRYDSDSFGVALKFKGKSTRKYDVSRGATEGIASVVNFNPDAPAPVNFVPHRFGIGLYKVLSSVILNLEYEFEEYQRGKTLYRRGLGTEEPNEIAYKNVHGASLSSVIKLSEEYVLTNGISYFTGNMGEGKFRDEGDGRQGISFGNIEAIPHWGIGIGAGRKLLDSLLDLQSGFRYVFGKKSVTGDVPGEGTYKFRMFMVTFRVSY